MVPHWGARPQGANGPSSTCSPPVALAGERTLLIASTLTFSTRASTASVPDLQQAAGRSAFLQHGVCSARSSLKRWSLKRCSLNHLCEAEDGKRLDQRPQCAGEREGAARALSGRIGPSSTALMALSPAAEQRQLSGCAMVHGSGARQGASAVRRSRRGLQTSEVVCVVCRCARTTTRPSSFT